MKICLFLEGSYPHVTGGVSTWVQMLIKNMPEFEFIIYSIGAEEKYKGVYKYKLPDNVTSVNEVFLDEMLKENGQYGKRYRLSIDESRNLKYLITGEKVQWSYIFRLMADKRIKNEMDFFMSYNFFDILREGYMEKFESVPFTEFFWTVRSMLVPLFFLLNNKLPRADIYHSAANGYAGLLAVMAKLIYKKPMLLTEHGIYSREREEEIIKSTWAKGYFKDMWIKFFYNICSCVYELSDEVLTLFERNKEIEVELGCPARKISIVPNGIEIKAFGGNVSKEAKEAQWAKEPKEYNENREFSEIRELKETKAVDETKKPKEDLGLRLDDYINIATITRVVPIKDIKTMIQSFNYVKNEVRNARFFIFGTIDEDEEYYLECRKLADRLNLDSLTFTGKVDVRDHINDMDVLVMTSISEGQPFVILEGMAAKKPFVTTDVGGCRELLYGSDDGFGKAGLVEPVMDIEKIANSIIKLCRDSKLRKKMGENGFNRVSSLYSYEKCVESYRTLYRRFGQDKK